MSLPFDKQEARPAVEIEELNLEFFKGEFLPAAVNRETLGQDGACRRYSAPHPGAAMRERIAEAESPLLSGADGR